MPPGRNIERPERAEFKPLPPDLNIPYLIQTTPNFEDVTRIDARNINSSTMPDVEAYVYDHVITKGLPLVIENWQLRPDWSSWIFNVQWLMENHGQDHINVRDLKGQNDIPMTFAHYLNNLGKLSSKFHPNNFDGSGKQQRLYGKDLDCPPVWRKTLGELLPQSTFYLSPIADLMSSLPEHARAENMMCYVGHEGTYTPAHKEMCASLGQNIMVAASEEDTRPGSRVGAAGLEGSSVWFMMGRDDRDVIAEYWLAQLGHDIEVESHFASVEDLANAPFTVYIVEQKVGDYVLVPPLAPHQVWNRGEYTIKAAWNRTTVDTLELALKESLPKARLVCRDEQYKNKAIIYETLCKYMRVLRSDNDVQSSDYIRGLRSRKHLVKDFVRLFNLFNTILLDQCFENPGKGKQKEGSKVEKIDNEYNVTCSFCRCNIWNRFLSCPNCIPPTTPENDQEDCYDVCLECYARGRSCGCQSGLKWVEQEDWNGLLEKHEGFREMVIEIQGTISANSPKRFYDALAELPRKSVARVCYEQNKIRPFVDITKDAALESEDDAKTIAMKKKTGQLLNCHVCKVRHERWKSAACSSPGCTKSYCYGNLWRAFDMDPCDDVLVKYDWKCPVCVKICSCGACQRNPNMTPYKPQGTFLGAVTKHCVDPRSVEVLVDFGKGNLSWLKPGEVDPTHKLKRKRTEQAEEESMRDVRRTDHPWNDAGDDDDAEGIDDAGVDSQGIPIDPALSVAGDRSDGNGSESFNALLRNRHGNRLNDSTKHNGHDDSFPPGGGMAGSRLQRGEERDSWASGGGGESLSQQSQRVTLPSPSAMLTGALPPRHTSPGFSGSSASHYPANDSTHLKVSYSHNSSTAEGPLQTNSNTDDSNNIFNESHLTTLEKNPIAFIAAAGLMQISNDTHSQFTSSCEATTATTAMTSAHYISQYQNQSTLSEVGASGGTWGMGAVGDTGFDIVTKDPSHVNSNSNSYPSIHTTHSHSHSTLSNLQEPPASTSFLRYTPINAPKPPPVPAPLPPSLLTPHDSSGKGKRKRTSTAMDRVGGDLSSVVGRESEREALKLAWVKHQQKLARDRKRWKKARSRSKVVILKISPDRLKVIEGDWREREAAKPSGGVGGAPAQEPADDDEDDLVTTDLVAATIKLPKGKDMKQMIPDERSNSRDSSPKGNHSYGLVEISDDKEGEDSDVSESRSKRRRRDGSKGGSEDGDYRAWNHYLLVKKQVAGGSSKKSNRRRSTKGRVDTAQINVGNAVGEENDTQGMIPAWDNGSDGGMEDGIFPSGDSAPAVQPRSGLEIRRLAEEKEDARQLEERKAEQEGYRAIEAEEARKHAEEEAHIARKRAQEKVRDKVRQRELEIERQRKEDIARAYRESKLLALKVATGEQPLDAWQEFESDGSEDELVGSSQLLITPGQNCAVIISPSDFLDRGQYESFDQEIMAPKNPISDPQIGSIRTSTPIAIVIPPPRPVNTGLGKRATSKRTSIPEPIPSTDSLTPKNHIVSSLLASSTPTAVSTSKKPCNRKPPGEDDDFNASRSRPGRRRKLPTSDIPGEEIPPVSSKRQKLAATTTATSRRKSAPAKPSSPSSSSAPIPTPIRTSSRQRKTKISKYTFDTDDEEVGHSDDFVSVDRRGRRDNFVDIIDLELEIDPDVGVLEREKEMQAKLKKRAEKARMESTSGIDEGVTPATGLGGDSPDGEQEDDMGVGVKIENEDDYNSRWRRRTVKW